MSKGKGYTQRNGKQREGGEFSVDQYTTARLFYHNTNAPIENKDKDRFSFDEQHRMVIWSDKTKSMEIRTFYDDGLTIKGRFIAIMKGDELNYKISYDEYGNPTYKTTYKNGLPCRIQNWQPDEPDVNKETK